MADGSSTPTSAAVRRAVAWVAALNLAYFFVEFTVARTIGSVSLFADSIDFLEDTAVNLLVLLALGWSARWRARVAMNADAAREVLAAARREGRAGDARA